MSIVASVWFVSPLHKQNKYVVFIAHNMECTMSWIDSSVHKYIAHIHNNNFILYIFIRSLHSELEKKKFNSIVFFFIFTVLASFKFISLLILLLVIIDNLNISRSLLQLAACKKRTIEFIALCVLRVFYWNNKYSEYNDGK